MKKWTREEEIKLDAKSVAYVVGELEQYSLSKTDKDVVGDAFEVVPQLINAIKEFKAVNA